MIIFGTGRCPVVVAALVAVLLAAPVLASAQNPPLAEVARKEQARRKATKDPGKVFTNKDLKGAQTPAPGAAAAPAAPAPAEEKPADAPKEPEKDEGWWRTRITQVRDALGRDEVLVEALQSRVNALSTDFVNRDDPYQRARIGEDRQKAIAEMDRVRAEIQSLKKQIEDIEEEARKAGVPPGWLR
jgi:hypothetical protein